jgi:acyl-CoA synthetase (AMP-forming)/AMP-acid ligase II
MPAVEASGRAARADDIAEIMFTSGTTGFPKGAMLRHGQIVRAYSLWAEKLGMRAGDRYLIIAPMFHSFGYKAGVLASLAAAAAMYPLQTFEAPRVLAIIETHRISIMGGPPTIFLSLLAENQTAKRDMSSLRALGTGGAMVPASMIRALQKIGVQVTLNAYGLTESTALVTVTEPDDDPERIAATSGRVIPGVEMRCVKLDGSIAAPGEPGEIQARGYNVMAGYFDDADATAQTITPDGWLRTGDVGVIDEHGYLQITDRMKDMFIMGGFNCYPAEIERLITECPLVDQVAVIGVPDDRMGEVGKAFVVPKAGFSAEAFLAWCRDHMANYKVPREVEVVTALPRNAMGKVQKFMLRNPR